MKAVLLLAVAAALAFAGGYGFGRIGAPQEAAPAVPAETVAGGPYYVEAGQLVVPMLDRGRTIAFILTQITLEASSADDALLVRRRLPHARSAMLEALFDLAGHGRGNARGAPLSHPAGPAGPPAGVFSPRGAPPGRRPGANGSFGISLGGREAPQPLRAVLIDRLLRQDNTRL